MVRPGTILLPLTAALLTRLASSEFVHNISGTTFISTGPARDAHLHNYWHNTSRTALHTLKTLLGPQGLKDLLVPETTKGDVFWHDVVARSSNDTWRAAEGRVLAYLPDCTAPAFAAWFSSGLADKHNNDVNAEHYYRQTGGDIATGDVWTEIIEGWGGVVTHFRIPVFEPADKAKFPMIRELPGFGIQFVGAKTLMGGTVFGYLHLGVRDIRPGDFPEKELELGSRGIEIYAAVWYGDAIGSGHLEAEAEAIVIEEINMSQQCQIDVVEGRLPVPGV